MSPFAVLGLSDTATVDEARAAWRRLRASLHPDHGGDAEKFKAVKAAWESIEAGWRPELKQQPAQPPQPAVWQKPKWSPPEDVPGSWRSAPTDGHLWPKKRRDVFPAPKSAGKDLKVTIQVTQKQATDGCLASFVYNGEVRHITIPPWSQPGEFRITIRESDIIGAINNQSRQVTINLEVLA